MAGAKDSAFSPGLALPVGSLVVPTTSVDFGTCCSRAGWGFSCFSDTGWGCSRFSGAGWCYPSGCGAPVVVPSALGPHHLLPTPKFQSTD
jgi:hypothetical protein